MYNHQKTIDNAKKEAVRHNKRIWVYTLLNGAYASSDDAHSRWVLYVEPNGKVVCRDFDTDPWENSPEEQEEMDRAAAYERMMGM